jgi:hypothetical protein
MSQESNVKSIHRCALPPEWVERIFATMLAHFGNRLADMWRDTNIADVKNVWGERLGGFIDKPWCIKYALDCLDGRQWPPTLPEFMADARRAPAPTVVAIEHKLTPEQIERNKARLKAITEGLALRMSV